ncbi:hypothetical protein JAAARDRAFT_37200 [Jaapia argillacea MUCL 33604]|uniref:Uncharacterized protein n=1 Tax=Jaapia argillacea MUCL 33604 TaxID=933084 RepID=A0A067PZL0_9AGAM|nr:hypothetical protein JAAARDRAFT_37200 [Jaapia argillacea MUCL 33604]
MLLLVSRIIPRRRTELSVPGTIGPHSGEVESDTLSPTQSLQEGMLNSLLSVLIVLLIVEFVLSFFIQLCAIPSECSVPCSSPEEPLSRFEVASKRRDWLHPISLNMTFTPPEV